MSQRVHLSSHLYWYVYILDCSLFVVRSELICPPLPLKVGIPKGVNKTIIIFFYTPGCFPCRAGVMQLIVIWETRRDCNKPNSNKLILYYFPSFVFLSLFNMLKLLQMQRISEFFLFRPVAPTYHEIKDCMYTHNSFRTLLHCKMHYLYYSQKQGSLLKLPHW